MRNKKHPLDLVMKRSPGSYPGHFGEEVAREVITVGGRAYGREGSRDKQT